MYLDLPLVVKVTLPRIFGDSYFIDGQGRVNPRSCTLTEYFVRLRLWDKLMGLAPQAIGVTDLGQVVTEQFFIAGDEPTQAEVDQFLEEAGLIPVRADCFVWADLDEDIWVGDTRSENFFKTVAGYLVPIDIRLWRSRRT